MLAEARAAMDVSLATPVGLSPAQRLQLLDVRRRALDVAINIQEQRGRVLRHQGAMIEMTERLRRDDSAPPERKLTLGQRRDVEGRQVLAAAGIASGEAKMSHWAQELGALVDLHEALQRPRSSLRRWLRG